MSKQIVTKELLSELGIQLPEKPIDEEAAFLAHLNRVLLDRVDAEVLDELDGEDLPDEETTDMAMWLRENVDDLDDIIQDELDILLGEVAENADAVNAVAENEPVDSAQDLDAVEDDLIEAATRE
jgi:hypothetical protein